MPAAQEAHEAAALAANVPLVQSVQTVAPVAGWADPASQSAHAVEPASVEKVPLEHRRQVAAPSAV